MKRPRTSHKEFIKTALNGRENDAIYRLSINFKRLNRVQLISRFNSVFGNARLATMLNNMELIA
ncbi:MAG: hypothetical protein Kow00121_44910 [Elainellaceae cyanobacterium]